MKMFIDGSCDIEFLGLKIRIEGNESSSDMELENHNLETFKHSNRR